MLMLLKWVFTLIGLAVASIPTWIFVAARAFLEPVGFIQNLLLGVVGVWALGGLQLLFLGLYIALLVQVIWAD